MRYESRGGRVQGVKAKVLSALRRHLLGIKKHEYSHNYLLLLLLHTQLLVAREGIREGEGRRGGFGSHGRGW